MWEPKANPDLPQTPPWVTAETGFGAVGHWPDSVPHLWWSLYFSSLSREQCLLLQYFKSCTLGLDFFLQSRLFQATWICFRAIASDSILFYTSECHSRSYLAFSKSGNLQLFFSWILLFIHCICKTYSKIEHIRANNAVMLKIQTVFYSPLLFT